MNIAIIQMKVKEGDTEFNYAHMEELLYKAVKNSPDVIVLPETWNTGFFPKDDIWVLADESAERTKKLLSFFSREYKTYIVGGSITEKRDGKIFNTCLIFSPDGDIVSSYSKVHLFSPMEENRYYTAGDDICIFEINGIRASVMICYDLRFPELARKAALRGAQIFFIPAQWPSARIEQMNILFKARAVENQSFTVLCNGCGEAYGTAFGGNSAVCDPFGFTRSAGSEEEIFYALCDTDLLSEARKNINVFSDIRKDIY